jgi:membrane associated rhomboid family serine protease
MLPLTDTIRSRSFPLVNWLIILANVLVFVVFEVPLDPRALDRFVRLWGLVPAELFSGSPLAVATLFSSMFLHGGWLHLLSNMWALYIFGDNVEDRLGSGRYLVFYLIGGVTAGLTQAFVSADARVPLVGASGAIAAVLAGYLLLYPTARVITLIPVFLLPWFVEIPAVVYLLVWFVSQFFSGVLSLGAQSMGGVAYWAHIGGFAAGLLLVKLFARRPRAQYRWYPDEYHPW